MKKGQAFSEAGLFALPAMATIVQQNGWSGLLMGSIFVAGLSVLIKKYAFDKYVSVAPSIDELEASLNEENADTHSILHKIRAQLICDEVTESIGMARVKVDFIDDTSSSSHYRAVLLNRRTIEELNDIQLKAIIAHEVDHVRSGDHFWHVPFMLAKNFALVAGGWALGDAAIHNITTFSMDKSLVKPLFDTAFIWSTLYFSSNRITRQKEFRSDSNSMRIVGDLPAVLSAYKRNSDIHMELQTAGKPPQVAAFLAASDKNPILSWLASHPSDQVRMNSLRETARQMAAEERQISSSLSMTPAP